MSMAFALWEALLVGVSLQSLHPPNLPCTSQADLVELATPAPAKHRLLTSERMLRSYTPFHLF